MVSSTAPSFCSHFSWQVFRWDMCWGTRMGMDKTWPLIKVSTWQKHPPHLQTIIRRYSLFLHRHDLQDIVFVLIYYWSYGTHKQSWLRVPISKISSNNRSAGSIICRKMEACFFLTPLWYCEFPKKRAGARSCVLPIPAKNMVSSSS